MNVNAVLLVPTKDNPHGLFAEGPCGARPPMAWQRLGIIDVGPWSPGFRYGPAKRALVLAWDGKPVSEGLDRVHRLGMTLPKWPYLHPSTWDNHGQDDIVLDVLDFAEVLIKRGARCTLVLLDEHDREIEPPA